MTLTAYRTSTLHGRADALAAVGHLLDGARAGRSGSLVVRGETGVGKSALLDHVAGSAADLRVLRGTGIEAERELPFAGLHLLLREVTDRIDDLAPAQAQPLRCALGAGTGRTGDRFDVGLAVLNLLADLAEERPLLCLVDDAHWLDPASADVLLFAARRLQAEGVAIVFAARDLHAPPFPAPGVPEFRLRPLPPDAAAELLTEHAADLPRHVRERIADEAEGNPLALLELADAYREGRLTTWPFRVTGLPAHSRILHTYAGRIAALPERTRLMLLVTAADGTCDTRTVLAAGELLGASVDDLRVAEDAQLLMFTDNCIGFRHPLIRSAVYENAALPQRLAVHGALARVLADRADADRRAWHLAAATVGPDEEAATALELSAEHARVRGGHAAVAAAYERAARLSPDPSARSRRLTEAARAALDAGQLDRAADLAREATTLLTDPALYARAALVHAAVATERGGPLDAHRVLTAAAGQAADLAPDLAAKLLFWAVDAAWSAGAVGVAEHTAGQAEALGVDVGGHVRLLAEAMAALHRFAPEGPSALRRLVDRAGELFAGCCGQPLELHGRVNVARWYLLLGDDLAAHQTALAVEEQACMQGANGLLPHVSALLARTRLYAGHPHEAREGATEGLRVARETGQRHSAAELTGVLAEIAAIAGDERRVSELLPAAPPPTAQIVHSLLDLGLGRYEVAVDRLAALVESRDRLAALAALPDLVEAAARAGTPDRARAAADWFTTWAEAGGQRWARAVALRCRALLDDTEPERLFAAAVALHREDGGRPFDRARTELLYGEWLRRARRRSEARPLLRSALAIFERAGARPWAERARTELRATGESVRAPGGADDLLDRLTPQEAQVVRLAALGLTNREIGARLYLSPRTVGHHLYKAYPKLGIASRGELGTLDLPR
ncbi:regulatory LuxR family protein [Prauserella shujinwangii]|uniref:Regulatory LuxR family protein n=1 Tax=Prauserella shujinwangii TaxID=1453103 RepID=A0A2T0LMV0_9PSEU|nr:helix-turn-helix transcriptional regulator [Prauserella shujinwangii]PRX44522.1 regulatory LuxR family protein [Prauserella shujinwangii]